MNGPSTTTVQITAAIFGTAASVCSWICVTACNSDTTRPTSSATTSGGPPSFSTTITASRIAAPTSPSPMPAVLPPRTLTSAFA